MDTVFENKTKSGGNGTVINAGDLEDWNDWNTKNKEKVSEPGNEDTDYLSSSKDANAFNDKYMCLEAYKPFGARVAEPGKGEGLTNLASSKDVAGSKPVPGDEDTSSENKNNSGNQPLQLTDLQPIVTEVQSLSRSSIKDSSARLRRAIGTPKTHPSVRIFKTGANYAGNLRPSSTHLLTDGPERRCEKCVITAKSM